MAFFRVMNPTDMLPTPALVHANRKKNLLENSIEIYIWNAKDRNIGHISLYIPDHYLYISFWPNETVNAGNATKYVSSTTNDYSEDQDAEGRVEDEKIEETLLLDVSLLELKWNEMLKNKQKYSLALFNCADALLNVLTAANDHFNTNTTTNTYGLLSTVIDPRTRKIQKIKNKIENFKLNGVFNALTRFVKS